MPVPMPILRCAVPAVSRRHTSGWDGPRTTRWCCVGDAVRAARSSPMAAMCTPGCPQRGVPGKLLCRLRGRRRSRGGIGIAPASCSDPAAASRCAANARSYSRTVASTSRRGRGRRNTADLRALELQVFARDAISRRRPRARAPAHRQVAVGGALLQDAQPGRAGSGGRQGEAQRRAREPGKEVKAGDEIELRSGERAGWWKCAAWRSSAVRRAEAALLYAESGESRARREHMIAMRRAGPHPAHDTHGRPPSATGA